MSFVQRLEKGDEVESRLSHEQVSNSKGGDLF